MDNNHDQMTPNEAKRFHGGEEHISCKGLLYDRLQQEYDAGVYSGAEGKAVLELLEAFSSTAAKDMDLSYMHKYMWAAKACIGARNQDSVLGQYWGDVSFWVRVFGWHRPFNSVPYRDVLIGRQKKCHHKRALADGNHHHVMAA